MAEQRRFDGVMMASYPPEQAGRVSKMFLVKPVDGRGHHEPAPRKGRRDPVPAPKSGIDAAPGPRNEAGVALRTTAKPFVRQHEDIFSHDA